MIKTMKEFKNYCKRWFAYNLCVVGNDKLFPNSKKKKDSTRVATKFNVTSTDSATQICNSNAISQFSKIYIDGVLLEEISDSYTFDTTGEHTIEYVLADPTVIDDDAFNGCTSLTNISIPNSVEVISDGAFNGCTNLVDVNIPDSVVSIGIESFNECTSLTSITIPNNVTNLFEGAFLNCTNLTSVTIGNNVKTIGEYAFSGCSSLTNVIIPNSVTSIGQSAFSGCSNLTNLTIGNGVILIDDYTFGDCTSLTNVVIPNNITSIGDAAFANCTSLISVTVEATVPPTIVSTAFNSNAENRKIYVPVESVTTYKTEWSDYADNIEAIL